MKDKIKKRDEIVKKKTKHEGGNWKKKNWKEEKCVK